MKKEFEIGKKLKDCLYLLKMHDFFLTKGICYLVMEFCDGGDLQKYFSSGKKFSFLVCY
jgi:serine/threonine protein kinase